MGSLFKKTNSDWAEDWQFYRYKRPLKALLLSPIAKEMEKIRENVVKMKVNPIAAKGQNMAMG